MDLRKYGSNIGPLLGLGDCVYVLIGDDMYATAHRSHAHDNESDGLDLILDTDGSFPSGFVGNVPRADLGEDLWGDHTYSWALDEASIVGRFRVVASEPKYFEDEGDGGWCPDETEHSRRVVDLRLSAQSARSPNREP